MKTDWEMIVSSSSEHILNLIRNPRESLAVELKNWFNPSEPEGQAKIIKTCIAMRNNNGGYLIVGFDNETVAPNLVGAPQEVRTTFHTDTIQHLVTKYASEQFEIHVHFPERDGQEFPVIEVDRGVEAPVAATKPLYSNNKELIKKHRVYVRSLSSNYTPSTTEATFSDWRRIVDNCFENREADIGRFLRRHLTNQPQEFLKELTGVMKSAKDKAIEFRDKGYQRFKAEVAKRNITLPEYGSWEASVVIEGDVPNRVADQNFQNLLSSSNPNYTGWPPWVIIRGPDKSMHPYTKEDGWEAFLTSNEFWRAEPSGRFYLHRYLEDDLPQSYKYPEPMTSLDFALVVRRTAETIAVALEFAREMGCTPDETHLAFAFRWSRLKGREINPWTDPSRFRVFADGYISNDDQVTSEVIVPLETPNSAIGPYVDSAIKRLFAAFNGFSIPVADIEDLTSCLINRNL